MKSDQYQVNAYQSVVLYFVLGATGVLEKTKRLPPDRVAEVEAFVDSLSQEPGLDRVALHEAITEYAIQHMGTDADLDQDLF